MSVLLVGTWIHIRRWHRHGSQRPACLAVHFPSRGRARWVGGRRWRLSRPCRSLQKASFYFPFFLDMLVAEREPTPCYHDAFSVGTPKWALWEKSGQKHRETTISPLMRRLFLVSKRTVNFFWVLVVWMLHIGRAPVLGKSTSHLASFRLSLSTLVGG